MELMSSLLLCVLVAPLPQTLGKSEYFSDSLELRRRNLYPQNKKAAHTRVLLNNVYGVPMVNENNDLRHVFNDVQCQKCKNCMERAMKAYNTQLHILKHRPSSEELQEDILMNQIVENRYKRDAPKAPKKDAVKPKAAKPKKNKTPKTVSVTKYDLNGEVYALKVKETKEGEHGKNGSNTCQVYSVKSSLPCESAQSNALLAEARRKSKKTDKKETPKPTTTTTPKVRVSIFKKRETDNLDMPPEFVSSTEEMF